MHKKEGINISRRLFALLSIALISSVLMLTVSAIAIAEEQAATIGVSKTVSGDPNPGGTLTYQIVVSATGGGFSEIELTDSLPVSVTYVANSLSSSNPGFIVAENNGVITSSVFALNSNTQVVVTFQATITDSAPIGSSIVNTVVVDDKSNTESVPDSATVTVEKRVDPIDLFIDKKVVGGDHLPGGTIEYSIVVSTTANAARNFVLTDTLPAGLTYVPNSLSTTAGFSIAESGGTLASTEYFLNPGTMVQATFAVTIDASTPVSTVITNTVMMDDRANDLLLTDSVATTVITMTRPTTYYAYLPAMYSPFPATVLNSIAEPTNNDNKWTVSWADIHSADSRVIGYELQEATDAAFTQNVVSTPLGKVTSHEIQKPLSTPVTYYYRVRSIVNSVSHTNGLWSGTRLVETFFFYEENFSDSSNPNNWRIVRQDTDTTDNSLSVKSADPGYLDLRMKSRFDYMMASNLTELPEAPFKITARMRLEDADPRHAGGIILGGDYDGTSNCPEDLDGGKFSTCFNEYYRFLFIAGNTPSNMEVSVKRIDEHSSSANTGSGPGLGNVQLDMKSSTRSSWIEWTIEVAADGEMLIRRDGSEVLKVKDTKYQDNRYFAFWSSTSDTSFSNTQIDWVKVEKQ